MNTPSNSLSRIFVVGTSAGGPEALQNLVAHLEPTFPGVILVVQHMSPRSPAILPYILEKAGPLPATTARDGEPNHSSLGISLWLPLTCIC